MTRLKSVSIANCLFMLAYKTRLKRYGLILLTRIAVLPSPLSEEKKKKKKQELIGDLLTYRDGKQEVLAKAVAGCIKRIKYKRRTKVTKKNYKKNIIGIGNDERKV